MEHNNNLNNNSNNCSDTPLPIEPNVDEVMNEDPVVIYDEESNGDGPQQKQSTRKT